MWTAILAALVPVGVEGVKQLITRFTGGVKATTVAEQISLDQQDIERLKAIAALDDPHGTPSQWVVDLRASARYLGALALILAGIICLFYSAPVAAIGIEAANVAFGFLFGQRIVVPSVFKK